MMLFGWHTDNNKPSAYAFLGAGGEGQKVVSVLRGSGEIHDGASLRLLHIGVEGVRVREIRHGEVEVIRRRRVYVGVEHGDGPVISDFVQAGIAHTGMLHPIRRVRHAVQLAEAGAVAHVVPVEDGVLAQWPCGAAAVHVNHACRVFAAVEAVGGVEGVVLALTDVQRHVVEADHAHKVAVCLQKLLRVGKHLLWWRFRRRGDVGWRGCGCNCLLGLNPGQRLLCGAFLGGTVILAGQARDERPCKHKKSGSARKLNQKPLAPLPFSPISRTHYLLRFLRFLSAMVTPASAATHSPATAAVDTTESPSSGVAEESPQIVLP
nr:MAG TPA: hypothetical protein [Caudoviricetes sp.]